MINVFKGIKDHISLCTCTLGIALLGYLGYRAIRWIINKCSQIQKTDGIFWKMINSLSPYASSSEDSAKEHWWIKITDH